MRPPIDRNRVHSVIPPYILERLARSTDPDIRRRARKALAQAELYHSAREERTVAAVPAQARGKRRAVYDAECHATLPGKLVRGESSEAVADPDRKSTRLNSSHIQKSRMPSSA